MINFSWVSAKGLGLLRLLGGIRYMQPDMLGWLECCQMRPKHNEFEVRLRLLSSYCLGGLPETTFHRYYIWGSALVSALVSALEVMSVEQLDVLLGVS